MPTAVSFAGMRALCILVALLPALSALAAEDPLLAAHKAGERAHVLAVFRADAAIESLNANTVQVWGKRRELRCPGGGQASESDCNPCTFASKDWAERPTQQWIAHFSWPAGDEAAHEQAMAEIEHFKKFFDLQPRGGVEKGGRRYSLFEMAGVRQAVIEEPEITTLRLLAGGKESTMALVPAGEKDVEIVARALSKAGSGAPVEAREAQVRFSSSCAAVKPTGDRSARVMPARGVDHCEVKAQSLKGGASATIVVRREVQLFVTYEGARADDLVLQGVNVVELSFEAEPVGKVAKVVPDWKVEGGTSELLQGGKAIKLRLGETGEATVTLTDDESGAAASAHVRRKAGK
jgi:hypothetical protein